MPKICFEPRPQSAATIDIRDLTILSPLAQILNASTPQSAISNAFSWPLPDFFHSWACGTGYADRSRPCHIVPNSCFLRGDVLVPLSRRHSPAKIMISFVFCRCRPCSARCAYSLFPGFAASRAGSPESATSVLDDNVFPLSSPHPCVSNVAVPFRLCGARCCSVYWLRRPHLQYQTASASSPPSSASWLSTME